MKARRWCPSAITAAPTTIPPSLRPNASARLRGVIRTVCRTDLIPPRARPRGWDHLTRKHLPRHPQLAHESLNDHAGVPGGVVSEREEDLCALCGREVLEFSAEGTTQCAT